MMKWLLNFIPKSINISLFSNNNIFKNIKSSKIQISQNITSVLDAFEVNNLNIYDFYTTHKKSNAYHEKRYIKTKIQTSNIKRNFFLNDSEKLTLIDLININNRIVLLGNPGIGKTKELKNLFEELWNLKSNTENIPFYINIKNFRRNTKFEELIPFKQWEELSITTFILDGLDEIAEIQDFISELELFLSKNKDKKINVVLSCRTNIYEKYLIKISEFKYFFLENLNDFQINRILKKEYNLEISILDLDKYRVYLENPFNLSLFAQFHITNKRFPRTQLECWDLFIITELKKLNKEKLNKRENIDVSYISKCIEKVAFTNELMEQNYTLDDNLLSLIGKEDKNIFEQITFIERLPQSESLVFRHRNYQEFFAAKFLSKLDSDKIIEILKIHKDINKTKPSLFNTITFLLNILEGTKYEKIKNWLLQNEFEILFHSEPERLNEETRNEIFEKYFTDICIEKTFWIGTNRRFAVNTIARFANLDFLMQHIKNNKNQFRSVKSAMDILCFVTIPESKKNGFKSDLLKLLFLSEYKEDTLRVIISHNLHKDEEDFLKITHFFKDEFSPEINHQIITILNDFDDIDKYFKILINSLNKIYKINPEKNNDKTIRFTEYILEQLIFKIKNPKHFLQILNIIFSDKFKLKLSDFNNDFKQNLIEKIASFITKDISFLYKITDAFLKPENNYIYRRDQFLPELIKFSGEEFQAFKYIFDNYSLTIKTFQLVAFISSKEAVDYLLEIHKNNSLRFKDKDEISRLKWTIFNTNPKLGYYFEKEMIESGCKFSENLPTEKEIAKNNAEYKEFIQENFNILFNIEKLLNQIKEVFDENNIAVISWTEYHEINKQWYRKTNYHNLSNTIYEIISKAIRDYDNQTFESITNLLKDDYFILSVIKDKLKRNSNENYIVKEEQIDFIKNKCFQILENFNYDKIVKFTNENNDNFYVFDNYFKLKTLYFFDIKFEFNYSTEFYLKTLKYCNIVGNSDQNDIFETIEKRINDKTIFDKEVIKNITEVKLNYFTLKDHVHYALEHKLDKTYNKIGDFITDDNNLFTESNLIINYCDLIDNPKDFLKLCCKNIESYLCWNAIEILKANGLDNSFIINIAKQYIATHNENFLQKAINILFYTNQKNALEIYINSLINISKDSKRNRVDGYLVEDLINYNQINELHKIKDFFDIVYDDNLNDTFDFHYSKQMLTSLINLFSRNEDNYNHIQEILIKIKEIYKNNYSKTFSINHLIESSNETYLNSLSMKMNFEQSEKLIKTI